MNALFVACIDLRDMSCFDLVLLSLLGTVIQDDSQYSARSNQSANMTLEEITSCSPTNQGYCYINNKWCTLRCPCQRIKASSFAYSNSIILVGGYSSAHLGNAIARVTMERVSATSGHSIPAHISGQYNPVSSFTYSCSTTRPLPTTSWRVLRSVFTTPFSSSSEGRFPILLSCPGFPMSSQCSTLPPPYGTGPSSTRTTLLTPYLFSSITTCV